MPHLQFSASEHISGQLCSADRRLHFYDLSFRTDRRRSRIPRAPVFRDLSHDGDFFAHHRLAYCRLWPDVVGTDDDPFHFRRANQAPSKVAGERSGLTAGRLDWAGDLLGTGVDDACRLLRRRLHALGRRLRGRCVDDEHLSKTCYEIQRMFAAFISCHFK